jgi:hypothetical protein
MKIIKELLIFFIIFLFISSIFITEFWNMMGSIWNKILFIIFLLYATWMIYFGIFKYDDL